MATTTLRKVGGSLMLAVPPAILEVLRLKTGSRVNLSVVDGRLVVEPEARPTYTLSDLLAASDYGSASSEDSQWLGSAPAGKELI